MSEAEEYEEYRKTKIKLALVVLFEEIPDMTVQERRDLRNGILEATDDVA